MKTRPHNGGSGGGKKQGRLYRLLALALGSFFWVLPNAQANPGFELPVVVAAADTTGIAVKPIRVNLASGSANTAKHIQLIIHNLQKIPGVAPAYLQINNGSEDSEWIALSNSNSSVTFSGKIRAYGGIGGGFHTVTMKVNLENLTNRLTNEEMKLSEVNTFRFILHKNAYQEGVSAYRVLYMRVLDAANKNILLGGKLAPMRSPGSASDAGSYIVTNTAANRMAGKDLWENKQLRASPGGSAAEKNIRAKCADCHTDTGYDLKYFGYSNESIYKRSRFHGLSDDEAKKVTLYIRSLPGVVSYGRPWNPPYQPGVGMSGKNVKRWAAGVGHWKVLPKDESMLPHVFPDLNGNGVDEADVKQAFRLSQINPGAPYLGISLIDTPIHLQLPDWNSWLPRVHPVDIWDDFKQTEVAHSGSYPAPYWIYNRMKNIIKNDSTFVPSARSFGWMFAATTAFSAKGKEFSYRGSPYWSTGAVSIVNKTSNQFRDASKGNKGRLEIDSLGKFVSNVSPPYRKEMFDEYAKRSLTHWTGVKYFELFHVGGWEDRLGEVLKDTDNIPAGEGYWGWPSSAASVFHNAPHKTASNTVYWEGRTNSYDEDNYAELDSDDQLPVTGRYDSVVWYHLEAILNPGNKQQLEVSGPVDWAYNLGYCRNLAEQSGRSQAMLYAATLMKNWQTRDIKAVGDSGRGSALGWGLRTCTPYLAYSGSQGITDVIAAMDEYQSGLYDYFLTTALRRWMQVVTHPEFTYSNLATWPTSVDENRHWSILPKPDYKPSEWDGGRMQFEAKNSADSFWRLLPLLDQSGVDRFLLKEFKDWCKAAWPGPAGNLNDWDGRLADFGYSTRHVVKDRLFRFQNEQYPDRYLRASGGAGSLVQASLISDSRAAWWARPAAGQWMYLNQRAGSESTRLYDRPGNELLGLVTSSNNRPNAMWRAISLGGGRVRLQGKVDKPKLINAEGGSNVKLRDYNWRPGFNPDAYPSSQRAWKLVNPR